MPILREDVPFIRLAQDAREEHPFEIEGYGMRSLRQTIQPERATEGPFAVARDQQENCKEQKKNGYEEITQYILFIVY